MKLAALFAAFFPLLPARIEAFAQDAKQGARQEAKPQESPLAAERKELAALRLLVVADRKFTEAKERLVKLESALQGSNADGASTLRRDVRALFDEVRRALGENVLSGSDRIDDAARRAIAEGDWAFIRQVGAAAVPALSEAVRATPDFLPSEVGGDPFYYLLTADPCNASELCDELAGGQGFFWKRRVLRALVQIGGFSSEGLWIGAQPGFEVFPGLLRQYEQALADPTTAIEALRWLEPLVSQDALFPTLRPRLLAAFASGDLGQRGAAWRVASTKPSLRSLYQELLRSPDADVRGQAAASLSRLSESSPEFMALARDPDAGVRWAVADRLGRGMEVWNAEAMAALNLLLVDGDENVRKTARRVLESNRLPSRERVLSAEMNLKRSTYEVAPAPETLARLASSADVEDRRLVAARVLDRTDAKVALPLLARLAADGDEETARKALETARQLWFEDPEACLRVVDAALANSALERRKALQSAANVVESLVWWEPTRALGMRWAFATEDSELVQACRLRNVETISLAGLPPELLSEYCRRMFVADRQSVTSLCESKTLRLEPAQLEALAALAADANEPAGLRLLAALPPLKAGKLGPDLAAALRTICADDWWKNEPGPRWGGTLIEALDRMPGELVNQCLLALAQAPEVPPSVLSLPLTRVHLSEPGARELLRFLLESRFGSEDAEQRNFANQALGYMGRAPALAEREWLERGARHPGHQHSALTALGSLRDPSYLPLLDELIRSGDATIVGRAAEALSGYLSNEAGELLLVAATKLSGEKRDEALAHLAKIREYQEARAQWATRKVATATRTQVVAELVAKLDAKSDEVKVEALRALATWEAVEAMPRLIELTQSGSKSVAAAARAALERLNAPRGDDAPH